MWTNYTKIKLRHVAFERNSELPIWYLVRCVTDFCDYTGPPNFKSLWTALCIAHTQCCGNGNCNSL